MGGVLSLWWLVEWCGDFVVVAGLVCGVFGVGETK